MRSGSVLCFTSRMSARPSKGLQVVFASLIMVLAPLAAVHLARSFVNRRTARIDARTPLTEREPARTSLLRLDPVRLRETRKEGSRFRGYAMGSIEGTTVQRAKVDVYLPIFEGEIRSLWVAPWSAHFTAEVLRNNGVIIEERRTFEEVRSVELLAPARLTRLQYELGPEVNQAILGVAAALAEMTWGASLPVGMAMVKAQDLDYASVSRLTGIDEQVLARQEGMIVGAARILDEFEGKTVDLRMQDGRVQWVDAPDLPRRLVTTLGRVQSLIDYTAVPSPALAVGEETVLSDLIVNELFPPDLTSDLFGDYDMQLTLTLVRMPDRSDEERTFARFEGSGMLHLLHADGNVSARLAVEQASLLVDRTAPDNQFLHRLEIATPVTAHFIEKQARFRRMQWDGDLSLRLLYLVDLVP